MTTPNLPGYPRCTKPHHLQSHKLLDGTEVFATAAHDVPGFWKGEPRAYEPDMAVYLSSTWEPATVAFYIGWPDFGLPIPQLHDIQYIARTALQTAREGFSLEVGCDGGHGRTGTFLACLNIMSDPEATARQAIRHVRENYCEFAIETRAQEWFVSAFHAHVHNLPIPRKPRFQSGYPVGHAKHGYGAQTYTLTPTSVPRRGFYVGEIVRAVHGPHMSETFQISKVLDSDDGLPECYEVDDAAGNTYLLFDWELESLTDPHSDADGWEPAFRDAEGNVTLGGDEVLIVDGVFKGQTGTVFEFNQDGSVNVDVGGALVMYRSHEVVNIDYYDPDQPFVKESNDDAS